MEAFNDMLEHSLDVIISCISSMPRFSKATKDFAVTVTVNNAIEKTHPYYPLSVIIEKTWKDLFKERKHCQVLETQEASNLAFLITLQDDKIVVVVKSGYLSEHPTNTHFEKVFKGFIKQGEELCDLLLYKENTISVSTEKLVSSNRTSQIYELCDVFSAKLYKIMFTVLVRKFVMQLNTAD